MKEPDKLFLVIDKMINPDHEKQELERINRENKSLDNLKNDKKQKNIYKENDSFYATAFLSHEKELAKPNRWTYFTIKVLPCLISAFIIIILIILL